MITITGKTIYDLLRYAYKNGLFDDEEKTKEIREAFLHMRSTENYGDDYEANIIYIGD